MIGDYNILLWNIVLNLVVVGSPALAVRGNHNKIVWTEDNAFGDEGIVLDGINNQKNRRVVPPPFYDLLYLDHHKLMCPADGFAGFTPPWELDKASQGVTPRFPLLPPLGAPVPFTPLALPKPPRP